MDQLQLELVKGIFEMGFQIESYVPGTITAEQYKAITGKDYVATAPAQPAQKKHSRLRNTQYINKPHSNERGFYCGRL